MAQTTAAPVTAAAVRSSAMVPIARRDQLARAGIGWGGGVRSSSSTINRGEGGAETRLVAQVGELSHSLRLAGRLIAADCGSGERLAIGIGRGIGRMMGRSTGCSNFGVNE